METLFTSTDNSIDIVGAFIFAYAAYWSVRYLIQNNLNTTGKILYVLVALLSMLHVFQVCMQLFYGGATAWSVWLWNPINYLTAVFFIMAVERIHKKELRNRNKQHGK